MTRRSLVYSIAILAVVVIAILTADAAIRGRWRNKGNYLVVSHDDECQHCNNQFQLWRGIYYCGSDSTYAYFVSQRSILPFVITSSYFRVPTSELGILSGFQSDFPIPMDKWIDAYPEFVGD